MINFFKNWLAKFHKAKKSDTIESITLDFKTSGNNDVRRKFIIPVGKKMSDEELKAFMQRMKEPIDLEADIRLPEPSEELKIKFKSDYYL